MCTRVSQRDLAGGPRFSARIRYTAAARRRVRAEWVVIMPEAAAINESEPEAGPFAAPQGGPAEAVAAAPRATGWRQTLAPYLQLPLAVHILCLGSFVNRAGSFVTVFMTIYVSEQLGYGVQFAANCFGVFGIGSIISSLAGGQLADRFGRKPIMLFALFGAATALVAMGFVQHQWGFLTLILMFSLTVELYRPAASAMMGDLVPQIHRPLAYGLMYIAFNLGFAVAAPVGGFLAEYSFQLLFLGDAATTATYGLIILLFIRETLPATTADSSSDAASDAAAATPVRVTWSQAMAHIARDTTFLLFALATLLTSLVFMQAFSTLPIYLSQLGFTREEIGLLLSVNGILIVVCQIPVTHFMNRFHRVMVIIIGEVAIAIGFGLTTFAETGPLFLTTIIVWTMGEVIQAAFKQSLVADMAPADMRGRYMGVFSLCHAIGLTVGAPAGGRILDTWGPGVLWPLCFGIVMVAAGVYVLVFWRTRHQPTPSVD